MKRIIRFLSFLLVLNGHTYIVSRGVGNAVPVPRVFNRGEIVVITLKRKAV